MLHESRASDAVVYDSVAEIRRLLNVYTCTKTIWPYLYNASNTNDRLCKGFSKPRRQVNQYIRLLLWKSIW